MGNELTEGPVTKSMLRFAVPIILGDLLQQCYNIADTVIVGRFLGADALAAVGSSFSLMTFLTSILLGLAMGSGTVFSIRFGQKDRKALKECVLASFVLLFAVTVFLMAVIFAGIDEIIWCLRTPGELETLMKEYLIVIFAGMFGIFLYNFFAALLRSLGNSVVPLIFLAVSAGLNIGLDLWFVAGLEWGVAGAAGATVISQYVSGIGIAVYTRVRFPELIRKEKGIRLRKERIREITGFSALTCLQQSIMNESGNPGGRFGNRILSVLGKETTLDGREKNFLKKSARIFCLIMVKLLQAVFEGVAADAVNHCLKSSFGKIPPAENQIHGCQAQGNEFQFREKGGIQTCAQAGVGGFG